MNYTEEQINLIVLQSFGEVTRRLYRESGAFSGPVFLQALKNLIKSDKDGVYNKVSEYFFDASYREKVLAHLKSAKVECVTYLSEGYPEGLKAIPDPPAVLFCRGDSSLLSTECFSVVGSRRTVGRAAEICRRFARALSQKFTIVSGNAYGADESALFGALEGGRAISVLAYGHNYAYSGTTGKLTQKVEREGLVISEYFPTVSPRSYYFPVRNRIIAALSRGTLIASAGLKSGALITADYCEEYGRDLFAVPYEPGILLGEGCNLLIKRGATLADRPEDILSQYGYGAKERANIPLSAAEREVLNAIGEAGDCSAGYLAERLSKPTFELIPLLSALEIKKLIVRLGGNRYSRL